MRPRPTRRILARLRLAQIIASMQSRHVVTLGRCPRLETVTFLGPRHRLRRQRLLVLLCPPNILEDLVVGRLLLAGVMVRLP